MIVWGGKGEKRRSKFNNFKLDKIIIILRERYEKFMVIYYSTIDLYLLSFNVSYFIPNNNTLGCVKM